MSPSELKELLEKLGAKRDCDDEAIYYVTRVGCIIATDTFNAVLYSKAVVKEEIRLALREEGYRIISTMERPSGTYNAIADGWLGIEDSKSADGPDELHALATLWKKVKG